MLYLFEIGVTTRFQSIFNSGSNSTIFNPPTTAFGPDQQPGSGCCAAQYCAHGGPIVTWHASFAWSETCSLDAKEPFPSMGSLQVRLDWLPNTAQGHIGAGTSAAMPAKLAPTGVPLPFQMARLVGGPGVFILFGWGDCFCSRKCLQITSFDVNKFVLGVFAVAGPDGPTFGHLYNSATASSAVYSLDEARQIQFRGSLVAEPSP